MFVLLIHLYIEKLYFYIVCLLFLLALEVLFNLININNYARKLQTIVMFGLASGDMTKIFSSLQIFAQTRLNSILHLGSKPS